MTDPSVRSSRILVFNQARRGSVTGQSVGTSMLLNAIVVDSANGKLAVGPPFIPTSAYGPYWVVAASSKPYTWALISGGPPAQQGANGTCKTASGGGGFNGSGEGLWIFVRDPTSPNVNTYIKEARDAAAAKGFDLSAYSDSSRFICPNLAPPRRTG
jgi:lipocalin